ncbi:MAG: HD domain-containing phosphohydrolase [bacterium]|nr:response regulator [bacterium]MBU1916888.1 response regulator [bacterium]
MSAATYTSLITDEVQSVPKVLIVDDNETNVELICMHLKPLNYQIHKAYDGDQALQMVAKDEPDLILLDLMMPRISGYEVCQRLKSDPKTALIPIIIITALRELDDKIKAMDLGADDFLIKPFNKIELLTRIRSLLRMKQLYDELDHSESVVFALAETLEAKDIYTRGHSERVSKYSVILARELGLSVEEIEVIKKGALLHDIGKIGVKDTVLNKIDKLTPEEIAHIRTHPARGFEICKTLKSFKKFLPIIRWHHERIDGKGHPDGLTGDQLPVAAKICSVADAFDAMTSNRPYRKGISPQQAASIFEREMTTGQWEPEIVKIFIALVRRSYKDK